MSAPLQDNYQAIELIMTKVKTQRIKTLTEFHRLRGLPKPEHPLISVIDYSKIVRPPEISQINWVLDFYNISLKRGINAKMKYGQQEYDFDEGVMFFIAPNQVFRIEAEPGATTDQSGWMLLIHPDFFWNTGLAKSVNSNIRSLSVSCSKRRPANLLWSSGLLLTKLSAIPSFSSRLRFGDERAATPTDPKAPRCRWAPRETGWSKILLLPTARARP